MPDDELGDDRMAEIVENELVRVMEELDMFKAIARDIVSYHDRLCDLSKPYPSGAIDAITRRARNALNASKPSGKGIA